MSKKWEVDAAKELTNGKCEVEREERGAGFTRGGGGNEGCRTDERSKGGDSNDTRAHDHAYIKETYNMRYIYQERGKKMGERGKRMRHTERRGGSDLEAERAADELELVVVVAGVGVKLSEDELHGALFEGRLDLSVAHHLELEGELEEMERVGDDSAGELEGLLALASGAAGSALLVLLVAGEPFAALGALRRLALGDRKSTPLNSSHADKSR